MTPATPGPIERLKPYFKPRPRARPAAAAATAPAAAPPAAPAAAPPASAAPPAASPADGLAERRRQLARRYAELQSDLGGLVYEMAIRDSFRTDVVVRRAAEMQAVDRELTAVEQALGLAAVAGAAVSCPRCGTPATAGAAFCGRCGATIGAAAGAR